MRAEPGVGTASLRRLLELRAGDRFEFQRQQRDRDRLAATLREQGYLEARVRARQQPGPGDDTVALTYDVVRGPRTDLVVTGYDLPPAVHRDIEALWTRAVFDTFLLGEIEVRVAEHLAERGHLRAAGPRPGGVRCPAPRVRPSAGRGAHGRDRASAIGGAGALRAAADERELRLEGRPGRRALPLRARLSATAPSIGSRGKDPPGKLGDAAVEGNWYRTGGTCRHRRRCGEPRFAGRRAERGPGRRGPRFRRDRRESPGRRARPGRGAGRGGAEAAPSHRSRVAAARPASGR